MRRIGSQLNLRHCAKSKSVKSILYVKNYRLSRMGDHVTASFSKVKFVGGKTVNAFYFIVLL